MENYDKIGGIINTGIEQKEIGAQIAQQGFGTMYKASRCYLKVGNNTYKLYRYSQKEIENFIPMPNPYQQQQIPINVTMEDFYLENKQVYDGKHCEVEGTIDFEKKIVYNATIK